MLLNLASDYYQVGGSLQVDAPSYVERQADEKLYNALKRGKFCYVLNCRQMGKSSLRVQIMQRLKKEGVNCAFIDFSKMGSEALTPERWYRGVITELWRGFDLLEKVDLKKWLRDLEFLPPLHQLSQFIEDVILASFPGQQIVIFIDEIDSVRSLEFSVDDFFALVRACYNQRVDNQEYDRLGFAMFGVVKPSDLIRDRRRTPFNIGSEIELTGFKINEIKPLESGLTDKVKHPKNVLKEILRWTGGQPFLTQKICQLVATSDLNIVRGKETKTIEKLVRRKVIENWESQDKPEHLKTIQNRLLPNNKDNAPRSAWERQKEEQRIAELLEIYQEIWKNGEVYADYSSEQMDLQLSGLVVEELGKLKLYNPIYREVFDKKWVDRALKNLCPCSQNVAAWEDSNFRDNSRLLRGKALKEAKAWAANKTLSDLDRQFLDASHGSDKRERKQKWLLLGGLMIAINIIGGTAFHNWRIQIRIATELVKQAEEIIDKNPNNLTPSMLLAIEADRRAPSVEKASLILQQGLNLLRDPITPPLNHQEKINKIAFSPDSQYLATASDDNTTQVWNAKTGQPLGKRLKHDDAVADVVFSPDKNSVATASWDNTVRVWNILTGERSMQLEHKDAVLAVAFSPDIKYIATASNDNTARLWNLSTGEGYTPLKHNEAVVAIAFTRDGKYLATASADRAARVWDTYRDEELAKFPHPGPVVAIAFSPDGKYIATISNDNMARVWEWSAPSNEPAMEFLHDGPVNAIAFSPDSKYLATASSDNTARVWDLTNQEPVVSLDHKSPVDAVAFNPDGKFLATTSGSNTARVWEVDGGQEVARINHRDRVTAIAFSPDGQYLATASEGGTARLWAPWPKDINDGEETREEVCQRLTRNLTMEEWEKYLPGQPYRPTCPELPAPSSKYREPTRFSKGERTLFPGTRNINRDRGIEEFKKENYFRAQTFFESAMDADPNDPEVRIYYNNALARKQGNFLTVAAVVPVDNKEDSAKEMLRGVAQAQDEFNQAASDSGGQFLEIVIANDGNDPDMSKQVARELVKDSKVLGIIGHNASNASKAALVEYEKARLPMISPTSSSIELNSDFFFRTVPSDEAIGQKLAEYAKEEGFDEVVVFYNPKSSYSKSLQDAFDRSFRRLEGRVVSTVDLSDEKLNAKKGIRIAVEEEGVKAVVLFPNTATTSVAIDIAQANSELPEQLQLFGGGALYSSKTLTSGREAVAGLVLAVPWFARSTEPGEKNSTEFASKAEKMWEAEVSWRTATSYDATWALIKALNLGSTESPSRESVFNELPNIELPLEQTSGDRKFIFSPRRERQSEPSLVEAVSVTGGPQGRGFRFQRVEE